jgi:hypothetical protein
MGAPAHPSRYTSTLDSIECTIEDQAFFAGVDDMAPSLSPPLSLPSATCLSFHYMSPVELILTGEVGRGEGEGAKSYYGQESLVVYNSLITFCFPPTQCTGHRESKTKIGYVVFVLPNLPI